MPTLSSSLSLAINEQVSDTPIGRLQCQPMFIGNEILFHAAKNDVLHYYPLLITAVTQHTGSSRAFDRLGSCSKYCSHDSLHWLEGEVGYGEIHTKACKLGSVPWCSTLSPGSSASDYKKQERVVPF